MHRENFKLKKHFVYFSLILFSLFAINHSLIYNNGVFVWFKDTSSYLDGGSAALKLVTGIETPYSATKSQSPGPAQTQPSPQTDTPLPHPSVEAKDTPKIEVKPRTESQISAGRSVYYSVIVALISTIGGITAISIMNSLLVFASGILLLHSIYGRVSLLPAFGLAGLSFLTPLSFFSNVILPDILVCLTVVSMATLLIYHDRLKRIHIVCWFFILTFSLISHNSHLALAFCVLLIAAPLLAYVRHLSFRKSVLPIGLAILMAIVGNVLFAKVVTYKFGYAPMQMPMIAASVIAENPGKAYLQATCPDNGYIYCQFKETQAKSTDQFLWSTDPKIGAYLFSDLATQRIMSEQQVGFFLDVLHHDPIAQITAMFERYFRQLGYLSLHQFIASTKADVVQFLPARDSDQLLQTKLIKEEFNLHAFGGFYKTTTYIALFALIGFYLFYLKSRSEKRTEYSSASEFYFAFLWSLIIVLCYIMNAAITGVFSNPQGRYQTRLAMIIPIAVLFLGFATIKGQYLIEKIDNKINQT